MMLGNCLIRAPMKADKTLDLGSLCEALLFFSKTHIVLDQSTLALFVNAGFLDDFIEMLKRGYVTASYAPEIPGLYSNTVGGLREHRFTIARTGGNQQSGPIKRSPDAMLFQLESHFDDIGKARAYHRRLCKYVSFKNLDNSKALVKAAEDITDPKFADEIARMSLLQHGVPAEEINFSKLMVMPLGEGSFAIESDIDFDRLARKYPSITDASVLFPSVGDARLDILLAAEHNAAFIGNTANQRIVEMILNKAVGARANTKDVPRVVYDFISIDTPSVREAINSRERTAREFIDLLGSADGFKKWLNTQNPDKDLIQEMLREKAATGWLERLPAKAARFGIFGGAGYFADLVAPGSSIVLGAVDGFLLDRLAKKWRPHFFVENKLRGFLDYNRID
jgi:hypothetical protein